MQYCPQNLPVPNHNQLLYSPGFSDIASFPGLDNIPLYISSRFPPSSYYISPSRYLNNTHLYKFSSSRSSPSHNFPFPDLRFFPPHKFYIPDSDSAHPALVYKSPATILLPSRHIPKAQALFLFSVHSYI